MLGRNSKMGEMKMKKRKTSNVEASSEAKGQTKNCSNCCHKSSNKSSKSIKNCK
jgi:hypothetical protein